MNISDFMDILGELDSSFFTGVPDSLLAPFCNYLMENYGISNRHIIGVNEGNCVALAAGYHLSTGKVPTVYMQNSGIGNAINPIASLLNDKVYAIPCIFIVGWRGEPGTHDEPQHVFQGEITISLLRALDIECVILDKNSTKEQLKEKLSILKQRLLSGKSIAFVVKKGALENPSDTIYRNNYVMNREEIIRRVVEIAGEDIIVSTTGKASRELFEIRERKGQAHKYDFLTVGSMGHSSSIALEIAKNKHGRKIWCIDGDGAALMHMGAMAIIGVNSPDNLVHIVLNNCAHETVGGLPTVGEKINLVQIALGCGYPQAYCVTDEVELNKILQIAKISKNLMFIEIKTALGSREDLGRPTSTAIDNKIEFMDYLREVDYYEGSDS